MIPWWIAVIAFAGGAIFGMLILALCTINDD